MAAQNYHGRISFRPGGFIRADMVLSTFNPLRVAIARRNVAAFGAMVVVFVGIVVDGARPGAVTVKNQPDQVGDDDLAFQPRVRVFVNVF